MNLLTNICIYVINLALMLVPSVIFMYANMSYVYMHRTTLLLVMMIGSMLMAIHVLYFIVAEIAKRIRKML